MPLHEWREFELGVGSIVDLTTWLFELDGFAAFTKLTA
jgi:hypothetical protein